ncbi:glycosyltransferase [Govanella unica]|uniref:Glycosyltransferase n=1 Tax=Govanella unica TaxID=2975056 RepID=A0A9X3TXJ1_9PROT|nr:glycosyltransferase [Govania unica]MDA5193586.1 glycosyltransferase [Govania unica]
MSETASRGANSRKSMKILLVAGFFPPYAPVSATRVNKLAKYLLERGHDVRVLAPRNLGYPQVMPPEIPAERITFTPVFEVLELPGRLKDKIKGLVGKRPAVASAEPSTASSQPADSRPGWWSGALALYGDMVSIPDSRIGWYNQAIRAGKLLLGTWRADVIYASAPPHTGLLVASKLARQFDIPWVCEYRDLWVDHPYYDSGRLKRFIEARLEAATLRNAAGFVTVTRTWADHLKNLHGRPVEFVMNGFDPADCPDVVPPPLDADRLTILYTGVIYPGKRDPSVLFAAMATLTPELRSRIRVIFHLPDADVVGDLARLHGVTDQVEIHGLIPRGEAILKQCAADVLLLLRWDDPREDGVLAGKLFEYIGARRPILSIGSETGEAADIIRDNKLGVVSKSPAVVAAALEDWLAERAAGPLPAPKADAAAFARPRQFDKLEPFLEKVIG